MPKTLEYPRGSLKRALSLAQAVDELGGSSSMELCADHLRKKLGGAFSATVSAAVIYGLLEKRQDQLHVTALYRDHKLAYTETDRLASIRESFFRVPVFQRVYERFQGAKLPTEILDKILIREFRVSDAKAARTAKYFLESARMAGLLAADGTLVAKEGGQNPEDVDSEEGDEGNAGGNQEQRRGLLIEGAEQAADSFTVRIVGPGMDSTMSILEPDDFVILEAMLAKVKRRVTTGAEDERAEQDRSQQG